MPPRPPSTVAPQRDTPATLLGVTPRPHRAGRDFWAYGGDFGECVHDAQFCVNGPCPPGAARATRAAARAPAR